MQLADFSALLQLAATLNIAFVAVEYAKAYTIVLAERVFNFEEFIIRSFDACSLVDKETLNHLEPVTIDGESTFARIEKVKREREVIVDEIEQTKESLKQQIHVLCATKSLSTLSLWFALYSTLALFNAGLENIFDTVPVFWTLLTISTVIYVVWGWWKGECEKQNKYLDFTKLSHGIMYFCATWVVCYFLAENITSEWLINGINSNWNSVLMLSAILPFSNFFVFTVKVRNKAKQIRGRIKGSATKMQVRCNQLQEEVQTLLKINKMSAELKVKQEN